MTQKKEILGTDIKAYLNSEEFKIHPKNQPRIFANTVSLEKTRESSIKVYLPYVTIERKISVLHGQYNHQKCFTIVKRKQFFMIMQ